MIRHQKDRGNEPVRIRCPEHTLDLDDFDGQRRGFAAADAQRRDAALQVAITQRVDQRGEDASAGGADRMAERARRRR